MFIFFNLCFIGFGVCVSNVFHLLSTIETESESHDDSLYACIPDVEDVAFFFLLFSLWRKKNYEKGNQTGIHSTFDLKLCTK